MRTLRLLSLFVVMMGFAALAEAQCRVCRNYRPLPPNQGACVDSYTGVCSSQCCWTYPGASCTLPDDLLSCSWTPELASNRYFTSTRPAANNAVALTRRLGSLQPKPAVRKIPRRCGASA